MKQLYLSPSFEEVSLDICRAIAQDSVGDVSTSNIISETSLDVDPDGFGDSFWN